MPGRSAPGLNVVPRLVSNLSLQSRRYAFSGDGPCAPDLFHDPDNPHDPGDGDRATRDTHLLSRAAERLYATPAHRTDHSPDLVIRVHHRRHRLPDALPDLSFLNYIFVDD